MARSTPHVRRFVVVVLALALNSTLFIEEGPKTVTNPYGSALGQSAILANDMEPMVCTNNECASPTTCQARMHRSCTNFGTGECVTQPCS